MIQSKVNNDRPSPFVSFMAAENLASTCGVQLAYIYDSTWTKLRHSFLAKVFCGRGKKNTSAVDGSNVSNGITYAKCLGRKKSSARVKNRSSISNLFPSLGNRP